MSVVKNLAELPKGKQREYFESFDTVLLDMDGVIWLQYKPIKGAPQCTHNLKKLGKGVHYVTNNTLRLAEDLLEQLKVNKFEAELNDIVNPIQTIVSYLKKLDIKEDIFLMGPKTTRNELKKNGFNLVPEPPPVIGEDMPCLLELNEERKVGAVILDYDFNMNFIKMQKASWYLKNNPDCLYLVTGRDKYVPVGAMGNIFGTYSFVRAIEEISGREHILTGKPSRTMGDHIKEKYSLTKPERVLFIGDSALVDMGTAVNGGFQKLLVLSGNEKIENVQNWDYPEELKPDYYVENLSVLNDLIESIYHH